MLKIFAFILPLYENPRKAFSAWAETLALKALMFIELRILRTITIKDKFVRRKTIIPIIGLNWGTHVGLVRPPFN